MREKGKLSFFMRKNYLCAKADRKYMAERYRILFNYGSIGGLAAFGWFLLIYGVGYSPLGMFRFSGFWIPILVVLLSMRRQSRTELAQEGYLFGRAFFDGITTAFLIGALKGMLVFAFIRFVAPEIPDMSYAELEHTINWMQANNMLQESDRQNMETLLEQSRAERYTAWGIISTEISMYFYGAVPVSVIGALIFKKPAKKQ